MTLLTPHPDVLFLEAARDAFAYRARRDPEHAAHWHSLVIDAARRLERTDAAPAAPLLIARDGEAVIRGKVYVTRLRAVQVAATVLATGTASWASHFETPGAAREGLRRAARWLDRL